MSERMTSIHIPGVSGARFTKSGRKVPSDMIAAIRRWAEMVLAASDDDFCVETYVGFNVQRSCEILQEGVSPPEPPLQG